MPNFTQIGARVETMRPVSNVTDDQHDKIGRIGDIELGR